MRVHQTKRPQNPARIFKSVHEPQQTQVPFKIHSPILTVLLWNHISLFCFFGWISCFPGTRLSELSSWKQGFLSTMVHLIHHRSNMSQRWRACQAAVGFTEVVCLDDPNLNHGSERGGCLPHPATECSNGGSWQGLRREEIHSIN